MKLNLPYKVRAAIYVANMVGTPVVVYLVAKNVIGDLELVLWSAQSAAAFALAGLNVSKNN